MTREEAIDIIKCLAWHTRPNEEDIEQAIKALKQEPILDKIRAEIVENAKCTMNENRASGLYKALQVIDKYKEE